MRAKYLRKMKKGFVILFLFTGILTVSGQGILNTQQKTLFTNEQTFGGYLNSNGLGADFRYGKYINATNRRIYEVNFNYVKHPKEYKTVVQLPYYTRRFVYGKENLFWELQGQMGNQHEIFRKYDYSSISIRLNYTGGVSLGFMKPIYYDIWTFNSSGQIIPSETEIKKFDPSIHLYNIGGTASFSEGLDEIKVVPGLTGKIGLSFEYSEREPMIHSVDAGLALTVYPREINIMATENKQYLFFKMYISYRFGSVIDISDASKAKSLKERREERREAMPKSGILKF